MESLKSPLYEKYIKHNAKIINFAGWDMPISYKGLIQEHESVRKSAGFFDISHMGVISIKGINPKDYLQKFFPTNLYSISEGQSCYSLLLNHAGGIIDDLIIYDLGKRDNYHEIFLIVNASRYAVDQNWIKDNLGKSNLRISNAKEENALIALQGKEAFQIFEDWSGNTINNLKNYGFQYKKLNSFINDEEVFVSKTGYTGEEGLEILLNKKLALNLWDFLISKNINPCGLGARDTLRLEAGLPLYGQELNDSINPYEAGLGWVVNLENNHNFFGRDSLLKISNKVPAKKLVGIEIKGKAIARKGYQILNEGTKIGLITSGSWSPSLKKPIALGYVDTNFAILHKEVEVLIRNKIFQGIISKKSFYKRFY